MNAWSYSGAFQVSDKSSKETHTITYKPDDPLAPAISLKLEIEVDHQTRVTALVVALVAAAVIVFAPYAAPALAEAAGAIGAGTLTGIGAELLQRCPA